MNNQIEAGRSQEPLLPAPMQEPKMRWLIRRDLYSVMILEKENFQIPWTEEEVLTLLRSSYIIGCVLEQENTGQIYGYLLYEIHSNSLRLRRIAAGPAKRGLGSKIVDYLFKKISSQRRCRITVELEYETLASQPFFERVGFSITSLQWFVNFFGEVCHRVLMSHSRVMPNEVRFISHEDIGKKNAWQLNLNPEHFYWTDPNYLYATGKEKNLPRIECQVGQGALMAPMPVESLSPCGLVVLREIQDLIVQVTLLEPHIPLETATGGEIGETESLSVRICAYTSVQIFC